MRILFVTNLYPPYVVGGNELLCAEVVEALRERGHAVEVLCGRGRLLPRAGVRGELEIDLDRKDETFLGGRLPSAVEAFRMHAWSSASHAATRAALRDCAPDLVVVWNLYMASLAPLAAARRSGRPTVVHVCDKWLHFGLFDLEPLLKPVVPWKKAGLALWRRTLQPLLRRWAWPPRLIAISDFMRRFYVAAGVPPADVDVAHLGVRTDQFTEAPRPDRPAGQPLRLLFAGSLWAGKGPQTAVRALGRLKRAGVAARLDVCGSGVPHFVDFLRDVIREEQVEDQVTLHGAVPRDQVRRLCQELDVLVFPSEWDEPFAAVPVEAMSTGMAVVATTAGGTPEAIVDGQTGLLVPPRDPEAMATAVRRLADDDALRGRLGGAAARAARERFDFAGYVDRLEGAYERCARGR